MRESKIEKYLKAEVQAAGGICWKFESPGTAGVPDRIILMNCKTVFVEVKAPGEAPRPLQMKRINQIKSRGVVATWVSSKSDVDILVKELR